MHCHKLIVILTVLGACLSVVNIAFANSESNKRYTVKILTTYFQEFRENEVLDYGNGRQGPFLEWFWGLLGSTWRPVSSPKPPGTMPTVTTTKAPNRDDCQECGE